MTCYLDTNVIVTRYLPTDPNFPAVNTFFKKSHEAKYGSEISVLELYCVFSRLIRGGAVSVVDYVDEFERLNADDKVRISVEHAIQTWHLRVAVPEISFSKLPISKQVIELDHRFFEAIRVSSKLGLRTLDTLHLAFASTLREVAIDLDTFMTLDREILSMREDIERELGIHVASPTSGA
jgi:predicted nucleic acid-binding protein